MEVSYANIAERRKRSAWAKIALVSTLGLLAVIGTVYLSSSQDEEAVEPIDYETSDLMLVDEVMFQAWMQDYGKVYNSKPEYKQRMKIFSQNLQIIGEHNRQGHTYQLGINQFTDMTSEEFQNLLTVKPSGISHIEFDETPTDLSAKNVTSVNWTAQGKVTPVKNQGNCGSCWAFSTVASIESYYSIQKNKLVNFSEEQLVDCSTVAPNDGCNDGWFDAAFNYSRYNGSELATSYPYIAGTTGRPGKCSYNKTQVVYSISGYATVTPNSPSSLAARVAIQPVAASINATTLQLYKSGVFKGNCSTSVNHGITIVGYGTDNATDYWLIKNSWGTTWGELGYLRLFRNSTNDAGKCGVNQYGYYPK